MELKWWTDCGEFVILTSLKPNKQVCIPAFPASPRQDLNILTNTCFVTCKYDAGAIYITYIDARLTKGQSFISLNM
jgi:hypothetical protein